MGQMKTILVVDDDAAILALVSKMLSENDKYRVLTAKSGVEGLEQSRNFKGEITLLLSDVQMPGGMSGVDLATAMAIDQPELNVLLMSGFSNRPVALRRRWRFLDKPFLSSQLHALIAGLIAS